MTELNNVKKILKGNTKSTNTAKNIAYQEYLSKILPFSWLLFILSLCASYFAIFYRLYLENTHKLLDSSLVFMLFILLMLVFILLIAFKIVLSYELKPTDILSLNEALSKSKLSLKDINIEYIKSERCLYYSTRLTKCGNAMVSIYPMSNGMSEENLKVNYIIRKTGVNDIPFGDSGYSLDIVFVVEGGE